MVCACVKFASFGNFVILACAHFGVADNILANFAIFVAYLEPPFLIYPYADPRFLPGTLTCTKFRRIKIEASKVDKQKKEELAICHNLPHLYSKQLDVVICRQNAISS